MQIAPYIKSSSPFTDLFAPRIYPLLTLYVTALFIAPFDFRSDILLPVLLSGVLLAFLSPPATIKGTFENLLLAPLALGLGLVTPWVGGNLAVLQERLEIVCTPWSTSLLAALWALTTMAAVFLERAVERSSIRDRGRSIRRCLFILGLLVIPAHLWLFSRPSLGPIECPRTLQFKNLRAVERVSFGDPFVGKLMGGDWVLQRDKFQALDKEEKARLFRVVTEKLNDQTYSWGAEELILVYQIVNCLELQVPATPESTEFAAAALCFGRRHGREFLWGPELRYFWRQGLPFLASSPLASEDQSRWRTYEHGLKLGDAVEICSVRYFTDWTCATSSMTLFGTEYSTSLKHLLRDVRIRWSCLILGTRSKEESIRVSNPEAVALASILSLKRRGRARFHTAYLSDTDRCVFYSASDQSLSFHGAGPPIFRGRLSTALHRTSRPQSLCRCER